jgi:hypothetical protein
MSSTIVSTAAKPLPVNLPFTNNLQVPSQSEGGHTTAALKPYPYHNTEEGVA